MLNLAFADSLAYRICNDFCKAFEAGICFILEVIQSCSCVALKAVELALRLALEVFEFRAAVRLKACKLGFCIRLELFDFCTSLRKNFLNLAVCSILKSFKLFDCLALNTVDSHIHLADFFIQLRLELCSLAFCFIALNLNCLNGSLCILNRSCCFCCNLLEGFPKFFLHFRNFCLKGSGAFIALSQADFKLRTEAFNSGLVIFFCIRKLFYAVSEYILKSVNLLRVFILQPFKTAKVLFLDFCIFSIIDFVEILKLLVLAALKVCNLSFVFKLGTVEQLGKIIYQSLVLINKLLVLFYKELVELVYLCVIGCSCIFKGSIISVLEFLKVFFKLSRKGSVITFVFLFQAFHLLCIFSLELVAVFVKAGQSFCNNTVVAAADRFQLLIVLGLQGIYLSGKGFRKLTKLFIELVINLYEVFFSICQELAFRFFIGGS